MLLLRYEITNYIKLIITPKVLASDLSVVANNRLCIGVEDT